MKSVDILVQNRKAQHITVPFIIPAIQALFVLLYAYLALKAAYARHGATANPTIPAMPQSAFHRYPVLKNVEY